MTPLSGQRLLDLSTVVERTGISARTWRRIIARGEIGVVRIGAVKRIPEAELDRFLAERFHPSKAEETQHRRPTASGTVANIADGVIEKHRHRGKGPRR